MQGTDLGEGGYSLGGAGKQSLPSPTYPEPEGLNHMPLDPNKIYALISSKP